MYHKLDLAAAKINIEYTLKDGKKCIFGRGNEYIKTELEISDNGSVKFYIRPLLPLKIRHFSLEIPFIFEKNNRVFANGFQSWTDTREYFINQKMYGFNRITEWFMNSKMKQNSGLNRAGDYTFHSYPRKKGVFYGYSYGYVREKNEITLLGSLNEKCGYTIIEFNARKSIIKIEKDLAGVAYSEKTLIADLCIIQDEYDAAFDKYFEILNIKKPLAKRSFGYTTWYNYYRNINLDIVKNDLEALSKHGGFEIFQLDDGYQNAVGDWYSIDKKKFPCEMKYIADLIHSKGLKAGLWLAPFLAQKNSPVFKNHSDWFVKDENGKPYLAGPNWGSFYALDIYNPQAVAYLEKLFHTVLYDWGFDMLKLDFLYAAAVIPIHNRTRGEIMCDAMELVRRLSGEKLLLSCGVPMMPAFGNTDFCRIGADISLEWKQGRFDGRENKSTPNAVESTVFRRHLDGRAFLNDPDVFLLRNHNIGIDLKKRQLIAKINSMFGNLLFCSDDVSEYTDEQNKIIDEIFNSEREKILFAEYIKKDIIKITYISGDDKKEIVFNVKNGKIFN